MTTLSDGDISKITQDTTTDDISYETSFFTDLKSDYSDDDYDNTFNDTSKNEVSRLKQSNIHIKKKYKHEIQMLKIELSQKGNLK